MTVGKNGGPNADLFADRALYHNPSGVKLWFDALNNDALSAINR
jgi:hypothetical protein